MAMHMDCLICSICLETFKDPQILSCLHSFCSSCLDNICKEKVKFDCPICRNTSHVGSWKKDFRAQEFLEYLSNFHLQNSSDLKICSECESKINYGEVHLCKECSETFCLDCSLHHKKSKKSKSHTVYALAPESSQICSKHSKKFEYFCQNLSCSSVICSSCAILEHQGHKMCTINDKAQQYMDEISNYLHYNETKLSEIQEHVCRLKNRKNRFEEEVEKMRLLLNKRRDFLLKTVNESYNEQITVLESNQKVFSRKMDEAVNKYTKLHADLINLKRSCENSFQNLSSFEFIKNYRQFQNPTNELLSLDEQFYFEFPILTLKQDVKVKALQAIKPLIGYIDTIVNEEFKLKDPQYAFVVSTLCKSRQILCAVYDCDCKELIAFEENGAKYSLIKVAENGTLKTTACEIKSREPSSKSMALLPHGKVLLLMHDSLGDVSLLLLSENMTGSCTFHIAFCNVKDVELISGTPCKQFVYFYCRDGSIYKFDSVSFDSRRSHVQLPSIATSMAVSKNCDHIAFCGQNFSNIFMFSFEQGKILKVFENHRASYLYSTFLSDDNIIAYTKHFNDLEVFSLKEHAPIKRMYLICQEPIQIYSIIARSSQSVFVGLLYNGNYEIWLVAV